MTGHSKEVWIVLGTEAIVLWQGERAHRIGVRLCWGTEVIVHWQADWDGKVRVKV